MSNGYVPGVSQAQFGVGLGIDSRQAEGIDRIMGVGTMQEDMAARNLQEQMDRFNFS